MLVSIGPMVFPVEEDADIVSASRFLSVPDWGLLRSAPRTSVSTPILRALIYL
jgi:hypothetical protein